MTDHALTRPRYMRWLLPAALGGVAAAVLWWMLFGGCASCVAPNDLMAERQRELELRREFSALADRLSGQRLTCPLPVPAQPAQAPPEPRHQPGDSLVVPDEAWANENVDFLAGCWDSISAIYDVRTGKPLTMTYCFDASGQGEVRLDTATHGVCKGTIKASIESQALRIRSNGSIPCPDGSNFVPVEVTCSGKADMQGKCHVKHGNDYDAHFKRKS